MTTHFSAIECTPSGAGIRLSFRLHGVPEATGGPAAPVLGYQVLDPETGHYLQEGEHRPLPGDGTGKGNFAQAHELEFDPSLLPRGRLRIAVSLLSDKGWHYRSGELYLRIELANSGDRLQLERIGVSSAGKELLPRLLQVAIRAVTLPVAAITRNHGLIRTMVRRDLLGRYRGSFGGILWSILNPLLLMATYYFVFGVVLRARFEGDPSREGFVLYFLAGMLPWLPFSEAVGRAPGVLLEHGNFIKKLVFPVETLPLVLVSAGLVLQGFAVLIFLAGLLIFRETIPVTALWLPALLIPQLLLTAGLCWLFAALGLIFRDLGHISGYLLTLWFFLTPICYPEESLPAVALPYMALNPFFLLVRAYRDILLVAQPPDLQALGTLLAVSLAVFLGGHAIFHKLRRGFADLL
jgi:lipopolysaccharide transport system permease protein